MGKACRRCGMEFTSDNRWFCSRACSNKSRAKGQKGTLLYRRWQRMKSRCNNKNLVEYPNYGGRGITVCNEWANDFSAFAAYMGEPPDPSFQLGRIDNARGYEPGNVQWETHTQNMRNTRRTRWVIIGGKRLPLKEACALHKVPYYRTHKRLGRGLSIEEALAP